VLREDNTTLTERITTLSEDNATLTKDNTTLSADNATLTEDNTTLSENNTTLSEYKTTSSTAARHLRPIHRDPYLLESTVPGIFAVGDVRAGSVKRVAAGVGEGSMVIAFVHQFLAS
jgi:thioredoxin reductase